MKEFTYNNKNYTKAAALITAIEKNEGKEAAELFYNTHVYPTDFCATCEVTGTKLKYRTFKNAGYRCGAVIATLLRKHKDVRAVKKIVDETLIYVEELNGYYGDWPGLSTAASKYGLSLEQREYLYNKFYLASSKCKLATCSNNVPFEHVALGACCSLHYNRDNKLKKGAYTTDKLKYECKFDGEKFTSLSRLSTYIKSQGWDEKDYYRKFVNYEASGTCKWCNKPVPFHNIEQGYRNFCYNSSCNVLWHNAHEGRDQHGDKISKAHRENQNLPTQKGHWLKRGYTEEEAAQKVRERQQTNSVESIMKRHNCSLEEATQIRKDITKKWVDSYEHSNYSKVSQELFWAVYEKTKDRFGVDDVFFATFNRGEKETEGRTLEYKVPTKNSYRRLDFFVKSINKCIEFDGAYWHDNINRRGTMNDAKRDEQIVESIGCKILHIPEMTFYKEKQQVIDKCVAFLLETD
jgi:hypothetical protein